MIVLGIAALVGYYLYSRSKTQGIAGAQAAASFNTGTAQPSAFVTARNNLETTLSNSLSSSLSKMGL